MSEEIEGLAVLHVDVGVTVSEMATWTPERITAFFDGIAKVRAAAHQGDEIEFVKSEWRASQDDSRHLERCLEEIARTVGVDPDDHVYDGELWASNVCTAIVQRITVGQ